MTILGDRYELGEPIASGGMSTVVRGLDRRLDRPVAVKLLRRDLVADPDARARFEREAQSIARLDSPWIVQVFDIGIEDHQPYLVMELVEGETLAERMRGSGRLPPAAAVSLGDQLLGALEVAHEAGVVHRDVKPSNILLSDKGGLKLADFGIAKAMGTTSTTLTIHGELLGTPTYLSPEQVSGLPVGPAADVYAAAVVLYEMLAGQPPFSGEEPLAIAIAHQSQAAPPLREVAPEVPERLAEIVQRGLEKDPGDRYADAGEMRRALAGDDPAFTTTVVATREVARTITTAASAPATRTLVLPPPDAPSTAAPEAAAPVGHGSPQDLVRAATRAVTERPGRALAVAAMVVLLLGALTSDGLGRPDVRRPAEAAATSEASAQGETATSAATAAPDPSAPRPGDAETLEELAMIVGAEPAAYGPAGAALTSQLTKLLEHPDPGKHASKLLDQVETWVDEGELDPEAGAMAYELVEPLAVDG